MVLEKGNHAGNMEHAQMMLPDSWKFLNTFAITVFLMLYTFILASFPKINLKNLHMMSLVQPVQSAMRVTS